MYSLLQRLRSLRHRFWYGISERIRWTRGAFHEVPARALVDLTPDKAQRITALRSRYQVHFELGMSAATAVNNYEYLDILDRAFNTAGWTPPRGGELCDIGCASFWYAAALDAFFAPRRMAGFEVEGHRLFRNGYTRIDHAAGYLATLPHARFVVADYGDVEWPADVITAWFPFVTAAAILAWRLPLSLLAPQRLFEQVYRNLRPDGLFVMVSHGPAEAEMAARLCAATGLRPVFRQAEPGVLSGHRPTMALLSAWQRV